MKKVLYAAAFVIGGLIAKSMPLSVVIGLGIACVIGWVFIDLERKKKI